MIFLTKKQFKDAVNEECWKHEEEREIHDRIDELNRRISNLENELWNFRLKVDKDFERNNTPTCDDSSYQL